MGQTDTPPADTPPTLAVAVVQYLTQLANEVAASPQTVRSYMNALGQFLDFARGTLRDDNPPLEALSTRLCRAWMAHMGGRGLAPASIASRLAALRSFTRWAAKRAVITSDPAEALRPPRQQRTLPLVLTVGEVQELMEQPNIKKPIGLRDRAILETLYSAGLRANELLSIDLADLDLEDGTTRVRGKGKRERLGILGPEAVYYIREYLARGRPLLTEGCDPPPAALFVNVTWGSRLGAHSLDGLFKAYARAAGLHPLVTPHTLRHSFATHMLNNGAGVREVQELLGHRSLSTTVLYTQLSPRKAQDDYRKSFPRA